MFWELSVITRSGAVLVGFGAIRILVYRSHALRGNAVLDALRPVLWWIVTQSVWGCVTQTERGNDTKPTSIREFYVAGGIITFWNSSQNNSDEMFSTKFGSFRRFS